MHVNEHNLSFWVTASIRRCVFGELLYSKSQRILGIVLLLTSQRLVLHEFARSGIFFNLGGEKLLMSFLKWVN